MRHSDCHCHLIIININIWDFSWAIQSSYLTESHERRHISWCLGSAHTPLNRAGTSGDGSWFRPLELLLGHSIRVNQAATGTEGLI